MAVCSGSSSHGVTPCTQGLSLRVLMRTLCNEALVSLVSSVHCMISSRACILPPLTRWGGFSVGCSVGDCWMPTGNCSSLHTAPHTALPPGISLQHCSKPAERARLSVPESSWAKLSKIFTAYQPQNISERPVSGRFTFSNLRYIITNRLYLYICTLIVHVSI